jgi:pre-mRNA-splicing helicase BRR2
MGYGYSNVLAATDDLEGEMYRPRTKETKATYELILSFLSSILGDIQADVLRSAADSVLESLKDDSKKDLDKKREIEETLSLTLSSEQFAQLVTLGKKISDYKSSATEGEAGKEGRDGMAVDDEYGVAVVFDEDDEEEDEEDEYEIREDEEERVLQDADEEDVQKPQIPEEEAGLMDVETDDFTTVIPGRAETDKSADASLSPSQVDAFWLQRTMAQVYPDAHEAQSRATAAMAILSSADKGPREVENDLMDLFEYDHFELVKLLTRNRDTIVWCTALAKASTGAEKNEIKQKIEQLGLYEILEALNLVSKPSLADGAESMDVDKDLGAEKDTRERVDKSALVPKKAIDLESLVFAQGNHVMTNKKVKLPEGSFKKTKKGYEEIHVPAPKTTALGDKERLVPIAEMPQWAQKAFKNANKLNRIQSNVYPIAFKDDDNMLLCAPTGAGK